MGFDKKLEKLRNGSACL